MKSLTVMSLAIVIGATTIIPGSFASAQTTSPPVTKSCIRSIDLDRTSTPNDKTILFHMKSGQVWRSDLTSSCPMLSVNGFVYSPVPADDICGRLQSIKVLRTGSVCILGPLMEVVPAH